jgi:hypothetical protein
MREAGRDIELPPVRRAQLEGLVPHEAWQAGAEIDDHVMHRAADAADQLRLRRRIALDKHAPERAGLHGDGEVLLRAIRGQPMRGELLAAHGAGEGAALIAAQLRRDEEGAGEGGGVEDHAAMASRCMPNPGLLGRFGGVVSGGGWGVPALSALV